MEATVAVGGRVRFIRQPSSSGEDQSGNVSQLRLRMRRNCAAVLSRHLRTCRSGYRIVVQNRGVQPHRPIIIVASALSGVLGLQLGIAIFSERAETGRHFREKEGPFIQIDSIGASAWLEQPPEGEWRREQDFAELYGR